MISEFKSNTIKYVKYKILSFLTECKVQLLGILIEKEICLETHKRFLIFYSIFLRKIFLTFVTVFNSDALLCIVIVT